MRLTEPRFRQVALPSIDAYGYLTTRQIVLLLGLGTSQRSVDRHLRQAHAEGLVIRLAGHFGVTCWMLSRRGQRLHSQDSLPLPKVSGHAARHTHVAAEVGIRLTLGGHTVISDRQNRAARGYKGTCWPDLVINGQGGASGRPQAIEVELVRKRKVDLCDKLVDYKLPSSPYSGVVYFCGDRNLASFIEEMATLVGAEHRVQTIILSHALLDSAIL